MIRYLMLTILTCIRQSSAGIGLDAGCLCVVYSRIYCLLPRFQRQGVDPLMLWSRTSIQCWKTVGLRGANVVAW